jgi:hypothetical protein
MKLTDYTRTEGQQQNCDGVIKHTTYTYWLKTPHAVLLMAVKVCSDAGSAELGSSYKFIFSADLTAALRYGSPV